MTNSIIKMSNYLDMQQKRADVLSLNINSSKVSSFVKREAYQTNQNSCNLSIIENVVEPIIDQIRAQHGKVCEKITLEKYLFDIQTLLNANNNFYNTGIEMASALEALSKDSNTEVISKIQAFASSISNFSNELLNIRSNVNTDLSNAVEKANNLLNKIASYNQEIKIDHKSLEIIDKRREALHELSEFIDIEVVYEHNKSVSVYSNSSKEALVIENVAAQFSYDLGSSQNPNLAIVGFGNYSDITSSIKNTNCSFAGLIKTRDETLTSLKDSLNQIAKNISNNLNIIHNTGTALNPPTILTGETRNLSADMIISGNGTLNISTLDQLGRSTNSFSINLEPNTTINGLINQINFANNFVNASINANGQLVINGLGNNVAISGGSLCTGSFYNQEASHGVSYFFGLNNLFISKDGSEINSSNIEIRQDIISNPSLIAKGTLTEFGVSSADGSVALKMSSSYKNDNVTFAKNSNMQEKYTSVNEYLAYVIAEQSKNCSNNNIELKTEREIYNAISKKASDISSVNPYQIMTEFSELINDQELGKNALMKLLEMKKSILEI